MTRSNPELKLNYTPTKPGARSFYVRRNGFHIGMVWQNGSAWGASRYNDVGLPEVCGQTRKQCAEKLAELVDKADRERKAQDKFVNGLREAGV